MNIDEVYKNLTGVNIEEQKTLWDERGKGYFGEYLVFSSLYYGAPGDGKFLMNLEIPKESGGTTEIDLLFIHETGVYVFEIKHYKGTIYGSDTQHNWVQYFRTVKNNSFYSPLLQNNGHIRALKYNFPDVPFHSFVVFTHPDCDIRVNNSSDVPVINLSVLLSRFNSLVAGKKQIYSKEDITALYEKLLPYSKVMNATIPVSDDNMTLREFIDKIADDRAAMEKTYKSKNKKHLFTCISAALAVAIAAFAVAGGAVSVYKKAAEKAESERAEMQANFSHVEPWNNGEFDLKYDIVTPEIKEFEDSAEIADAVEFQVDLTAHSSEYGLSLLNGAKYTVQLKNGNVLEYDVFFGGKMNPGSFLIEGSVWHSSAQSLPHITLTGVNKEDIDYIKIGPFALYRKTKSFGDELKTGIELEIFSRQSVD